MENTFIFLEYAADWNAVVRVADFDHQTSQDHSRNQRHYGKRNRF